MKKLVLLTFAIAATLGSKAQFANAGLETWNTYTSASTQLQRPAGWYGVDSLLYAFGASPIPTGIVAKQMLFEEKGSVHSGMSAAKLVSHDQGTAGVVPGILTNATPALATFNPANPLAGLSYTGGTAVTQRVASVQAWVKYDPKNGDSANITAQALLAGKGSGGKDSIVGIGNVKLGQSMAAYTQVGFNLTYKDANVIPDKLLIIFASSILKMGGPQDGSTLWVDEVSYSPHKLDIGQSSHTGGQPVICTPNPAGHYLHIKNTLNTPAVMRLYSIDGRLALTSELEREATVDISALMPGIYHYTIVAEGNVIQQEKLVIE